MAIEVEVTEEEMTKRVVWILGAGFSKSLGGPLLPRLLSPASFNDLNHRYTNVGFGGYEAAAVVSAFSYGTSYREGYPSGQHADRGLPIWSDAEEFIEFLDAASGPDGGPKVARLRKILSDAFAPKIDVPIEAMQLAARKMIAGECSFVDPANVGTERWAPYVDWARSLGPNDTIITFNYDLVLESLGARYIDVIFPDEGHYNNTICPILKLHGSIDWKRRKEGNKYIIERAEDREHAVRATDPESICIATPGPSKRMAAAQLRKLWVLAEKRIREADVVVFIGYRFPPSDADSRSHILKAIGANDRPHVEAHIVLGPIRGDSDVPRVEALLRYTLNRHRSDKHPPTVLTEDAFSKNEKTFRVSAHPLYAEDFFTVCDRRALGWRASGLSK